jgi:hypothetical protein
MDSQFNTLIRSYHDNFLQYRLTGNTSYQNSYQSAQQGIETILSNLESENSKQRKDMSDFYNEDVEGKLRNLKSETRSTRRKIVSENDQVIAAEMRTQGYSEPDMSNRYIALGIMSLIALGLMAWKP